MQAIGPIHNGQLTEVTDGVVLPEEFFPQLVLVTLDIGHNLSRREPVLPGIWI